MTPDEKHKVFITFCHDDDESYKIKFEDNFEHLFLNKSVGKDEINSDASDEYIKRLIQEEYITDASVVVVLVGPNTWRRKHVDWEISAGLDKKVGGYSGLMGILLPEYQLDAEGKYSYDDTPLRLGDNIKNEYAEMYNWSWVCSQESRIQNAVNEAFNNRVQKSDKIDNTRIQFTYNR